MVDCTSIRNMKVITIVHMIRAAGMWFLFVGTSVWLEIRSGSPDNTCAWKVPMWKFVTMSSLIKANC